MFSNLIIQESPCPPGHKQKVEIVERKGMGHPDSICDGIAERISVTLSRAYKEACGDILHHNIDKGFLGAGQVECRLRAGGPSNPCAAPSVFSIHNSPGPASCE